MGELLQVVMIICHRLPRAHNELRELLFLLFLDEVNSECSRLCQHKPEPSLFRKIPTSKFGEFTWKVLADELRVKAPTLLRVLSTVASRNDHRNKKKVGDAHHPGICMAAAVVLKERNREMNGLQSLVSLTMFATHANKQVR